MSEQSTLQAPRYVDYVDPGVVGALPRSFPCAWIAEESCRRVPEAVESLAPEARDALLLRATAFADDILGIVKADLLPEPLEESVLVDPDGRLHLIGTRGGQKLRIDEDLRIALIRAKPKALSTPRAGLLRQEARELLCFPLASEDQRPVQALQVLDLEPVGEPGMCFLELDAPAGSAWLSGRCDRLRIFGDGKVLIICFRPLPNVDEEGYQVGSPDDDLARLSGSAARLTEERGGRPPAAMPIAAVLDEDGDGADGETPEGAQGSADAARLGAADAMPPSESPFDQPGWAASVAPVLED